MGEILQGKNVYLYFMIERKLEYVGTGDGTNKSFTVGKKPIADSNLTGTVDASDVAVYSGTSRTGTLTTHTVSSVTEATGVIAVSAAPANLAKVYVTYKYQTSYPLYCQEYSFTDTLNTKGITPISAAAEETVETDWKYEGSLKYWDDTDIEFELMKGLDQTVDTTAGTLAKTNPIPVPKHNIVLKKVRSTATTYKAFRDIKVTSLDESGKGGDFGDKSFKLSVGDIVQPYTPTVGSGM